MMRATILWSFLQAYWRTRRRRLGDRTALLLHQDRLIARHLDRVSAASPFYRRFRGAPLSSWPMMDKATMLHNFDTINTAGLLLDQVWECAFAAERCRGFSTTLHSGITVGMSSGTSGQRGVFVADPAEQAAWAGTLLARMFPDRLPTGQRAALFLRSDNSLYHSVDIAGVRLRFFDLFAGFEAQLRQLEAMRPTIIVAPAQVLREMALAVANGTLRLPGAQVVSVAEVLEPQDRDLIAAYFGAVGEIYQASEGFLGMRCARGNMHLNEEDLHIEPQWISGSPRRFSPVVTDFRRFTQPVIRYRLDDVLRLSDTGCDCGRASLVIGAIEGRCDDQLRLPGRLGHVVTVFADLLSRALARALPPALDYRLSQRGESELTLQAALSQADLDDVRQHLELVMAAQGVAIGRLRWVLLSRAPVPEHRAKRRRIMREPITPEERL